MAVSIRVVKNHPFWEATPESTLHLIYDDPEIKDSILKGMDFKVVKMYDQFQVELVQTSGKVMWRVCGTKNEAMQRAKWWLNWYGKWTKIHWTNTEVDMYDLIMESGGVGGIEIEEDSTSPLTSPLTSPKKKFFSPRTMESLGYETDSDSESSPRKLMRRLSLSLGRVIRKSPRSRKNSPKSLNNTPRNTPRLTRKSSKVKVKRRSKSDSEIKIHIK